MSSFKEPLLVQVEMRERNGLGEFTLYRQFSYDVGFEGSGDTIVVPVGFTTDFGSIPWFARAFIPSAGRMAKPALLHDWLMVNDPNRATKIFNEALCVAGFSAPLRWLVVGSVWAWQRLRSLVNSALGRF